MLIRMPLTRLKRIWAGADLGPGERAHTKTPRPPYRMAPRIRARTDCNASFSVVDSPCRR
jgi:hypothetical protein